MKLLNDNKKVYSCFNDTKSISLPDELVSLYEKYVGIMNFQRIEYHIISSGGLETDSENAMSALATLAIIEELSVYTELPNIIQRMKLNGVSKYSAESPLL